VATRAHASGTEWRVLIPPDPSYPRMALSPLAEVMV